MRQLGGWLKMGVVGTRPAEGRVLLVGDAAGLVNPLQGEGIAQALASGQAAARAVLDRPADAGRHVSTLGRRHVRRLDVGHDARPRRARRSSSADRRLSAALTAPDRRLDRSRRRGRSTGTTSSSGAATAPAAMAAKAVHRFGRVATTRSRFRRSLRHDLETVRSTSPKWHTAGKTCRMSILTEPIHTLRGDETSLSAFDGKAILAVNVASKCGLTPQYTGLEALQEKYSDRGFTVVGFPCNQFGGQEPGSAEEIETFCSITYGVTFPMMEKIDVNGDDRHPIYAELTEDGRCRGPLRRHPLELREVLDRS